MRGTTLYFAYGSNLHVGRLRARIRGVVPVESALLPGHALRFNKRGRDGSGKCSVVPHAGAEVAGVIYQITRTGLVRLDRFEGSGYRRSPIVVHGLDSGRRYRAHCYVAKASAIDDSCVAYDWYRDIVVAGAESHGLPAAYIDRLRATPARPDPNGRRRRQQVALLVVPCVGGITAARPSSST